MAELGKPRVIIRFRKFEVNLSSGEIYKHGNRIKLQELPFRILEMLLQRPGDVVTREEIHRAIWPEDSDSFQHSFQHTINVAISKLRMALSDSAREPHYIETLGSRGYRFIAPIVCIKSKVAEPSNGSSQIRRRKRAENGRINELEQQVERQRLEINLIKRRLEDLAESLKN